VIDGNVRTPESVDVVANHQPGPYPAASLRKSWARAGDFDYLG